MNKKQAEKIVSDYITGWKKRDKEMILAQLHENGVIIEAHGPKHEGLKVIRPWLEKWLNTGSYVNYWNILSFYFLEPNTAFFEWEFSSTYEGNKDSYKGISIVTFQDNKILEVKGYQQKV